MIKLRNLGILLLTTFVLIACSNTTNDDPELPEQETPPTTENGESSPPPEDETEEEVNDVSLIDFFLPDGAKAHYKGTGNEFAELNIEVHHIGENFIVIDEDNGGVTIRKVYQVEEDQILVLSQEPVDLNTELPSEDELMDLDEEEIYLQKPLEVGTEFEDWTIIEDDGNVETPYENFEHVLIMESVGEDFINRRYLVPEYGEVLRESIMELEEEEEDFTVISALDSIE